MSSELQHTSAMFTGDNTQLHVVFLPSFLSGHMIPLVQFARLFAARGVRSTIITTVYNALTFQASVDRDIAAGYSINVHTVNFPALEVGIPIGVENVGTAPKPEMASAVFRGMMVLQTPIEQLIRDLAPDCICSDVLFPWTIDLADELKIPGLFFYTTSVFSETVFRSLKVNAPQAKVKSESESFVVPNLPDKITMNRSQVPQHLKTKTTLSAIMEAVEQSEKRSYGMVHNTFYEVEPAYVDHNDLLKGTKTWSVGPLFQFFNNDDDNGGVSEKHTSLSWLDNQKPKSVIYACFGSMVRFPDAQITEIALALEESKQPFVWVVGKKGGEEKIGGMPEGFQERIEKESKGLILTAWAPQVKILQHPAVGGFLTHCGWNSVMEAVGAGVPMMTWPLFGEQFCNEKLVELLGIGVGVGAEFGNSRPVIRSPIVEKGSILEAIRVITGGSAIAESIRSKSKALSIIAKEAVEPGGSSFNCLTALIQELNAVKLASKSLP